MYTFQGLFNRVSVALRYIKSQFSRLIKHITLAQILNKTELECNEK